MAVAHKFGEKARTDDVISGESVDFAGLLLSGAVLHGLRNAGFEHPSPIQLKAIPLGRCGLDLIVQAKSGTGKTCVFSVIALESIQVKAASTQVLVLAPTREIAIQIWEVIGSLGKAIPGLKCHTFIGGLPLHEDKKKLQLCHIAVGTPGRIQNLLETGCLKAESIRMFILDEADKLLEDSFQEQINWIYSALPENKQMLALSATYPEYLAQHLTVYMRNPTFIRLNISDPTLLGIKQYFTSVPSHPLPHKVFEAKTAAVVQLLSSVSFHQCLVFSNMQSRAQNLESELTSRGWPTTCIAGCLDQKDRIMAMAKLKSYQCRVLISTDLTSRGIDADKVNLVINLDVPKDHETYLHRIGRAGRFGSYGAAVTVVSDGQELLDMQSIERKISTQIQTLPDPIPSDLVKRQLQVNLDDVVSTEQLITRDQHSGPPLVSPDLVSKPSPTNPLAAESAGAAVTTAGSSDSSQGDSSVLKREADQVESTARGSHKGPSERCAIEVAETSGVSCSVAVGDKPAALELGDETADLYFPPSEEGKLSRDNSEMDSCGTEPKNSSSGQQRQSSISANPSSSPHSFESAKPETFGHNTNNSPEILVTSSAANAAVKPDTEVTAMGTETNACEENDDYEKQLNVDSAQQRVLYSCLKKDDAENLETAEDVQNVKESLPLSSGKKDVKNNAQVSGVEILESKKPAPMSGEGERKSSASGQDVGQADSCTGNGGSTLPQETKNGETLPSVGNGDHSKLHAQTNTPTEADNNHKSDSMISSSPATQNEGTRSVQGWTEVSADCKVDGDVQPVKDTTSSAAEQNGQKAEPPPLSHTQLKKSAGRKSKTKSTADMWSQMLAGHGYEHDKPASRKKDPPPGGASGKGNGSDKLKRPGDHSGKAKKKTDLSWEDELALYVAERKQKQPDANSGGAEESKASSEERDTSNRPRARARRRLGNGDKKKEGEVVQDLEAKQETPACDKETHSKSSPLKNAANETDESSKLGEAQPGVKEENGSSRDLSQAVNDTQANQRLAVVSSAQGVNHRSEGPRMVESSGKLKSMNGKDLHEKGRDSAEFALPDKAHFFSRQKPRARNGEAKSVARQDIGSSSKKADVLESVIVAKDKTENLRLSGEVPHGNHGDVAASKTCSINGVQSPSSVDLSGVSFSASGALRKRDSVKPVSYSAILEDYQQLLERGTVSKPLTASEIVQKTFRMSQPALGGQRGRKQTLDFLHHFHKQLKQKATGTEPAQGSEEHNQKRIELVAQVDQEAQTENAELPRPGTSKTGPHVFQTEGSDPGADPPDPRTENVSRKHMGVQMEHQSMKVEHSGERTEHPGIGTTTMNIGTENQSKVADEAESKACEPVLFTKQSSRPPDGNHRESRDPKKGKGRFTLPSHSEVKLSSVVAPQGKEKDSNGLGMEMHCALSATTRTARMKVDLSDHKQKSQQYKQEGELVSKVLSEPCSAGAAQQLEGSSQQGVGELPSEGSGDSTSDSSSSSSSESENKDLSAAEHADERPNLVCFKNYHTDELSLGARKKKPKSQALRERRKQSRGGTMNQGRQTMVSKGQTGPGQKHASKHGQQLPVSSSAENNAADGSSAPWTWDAWYSAIQNSLQTHTAQTSDGGENSQGGRPASLPWAPSFPYYTYPAHYPYTYQSPYTPVHSCYPHQPTQAGDSFPWWWYPWYQWYQQHGIQQPPHFQYPYNRGYPQQHQTRSARAGECSSQWSQAAKAESLKEYVHGMARFYKDLMGSRH